MNETPHTPESLRVAKEWTQFQLAERATQCLREITGDPAASVSPQTVARFEKCRSIATDHLRAIASALGIAVDGLLAAQDVVRARRAESRGKPGSTRRRTKGVA